MLTDAVARAACRRPRPVRYLPGARGSRATRGPRPPPQEHARTATDRRPPTLPDAQRPRRVRAGRTALHHRVQPEPDTEHSNTDDHEGEPKCDDSRTTTHADRDTIAEFGRRIKEEFLRAGNERIAVVLPGDEPLEFRVFLCEDGDEAARLPPPPLVEERGPDPVTKVDGRHPAYLRARDEAFGRSNGICQLCGAA